VRIAIGSDHAGYQLKEIIKGRLAGSGVEVDDLGTTNEASVDYPDYAAAVADRVASGASDRGILICGTGIGMAISANKVRGIRAASVESLEAARLSRAHNDANVLTLGARITPADLALGIVQTFLATPFDGGRHQRRVDKITALENRHPDVSP
jgi:ribose 5-phosphate isomerase B